MKLLKFNISLLLLLLVFSNTSCKKYLDKQPNKKLAVLTSLDDAQYLLDNVNQLNWAFSAVPEITSDNYYLAYSSWQSLPERERAYYIWQKYDLDGSQWNTYYSSIYTANVVLDYLSSISSTADQSRQMEIKGSALFFRSYYYYHLAQLYAQPYDKNTAQTDLGLPLRLNSDFNEVSVRSSVKNTYNKIISDLKEAALLLPSSPTFKNRPSKAAAYGALAKTYLVMQDYSAAGLYADSALQLKSFLMRYDTLSTSAANPFVEYLPETIFHGVGNAVTPLTQSYHIVDSNLLKTYDTNDLRLQIFFKKNTNGTYTAKGMYSGYGYLGFPFAGIATNELYLIRAEASARAGNVIAAMNDLNAVLVKRWKPGTFAPLSAPDASQALILILKERRKELVYTLTRWSDLRRLNKETQFQTTIKRVLNGQDYILLPNSAGYTLQIPKVVIDKTGMPQNP